MISNTNDYTICNALTWGLCRGHIREMGRQTEWRGWVVQLVLAASEALPVIGQIISLFELGIVSFFLPSSPAKKAPEKVVSRETGDPSVAPSAAPLPSTEEAPDEVVSREIGDPSVAPGAAPLPSAEMMFLAIPEKTPVRAELTEIEKQAIARVKAGMSSEERKEKDMNYLESSMRTYPSHLPLVAEAFGTVTVGTVTVLHPQFKLLMIYLLNWDGARYFSMLSQEDRQLLLNDGGFMESALRLCPSLQYQAKIRGQPIALPADS